MLELSVEALALAIEELLSAAPDTTTTLKLHSSWHNFDNPFYVNGMDGASPLDALLVINELTDRIKRYSSLLDVESDGIESPSGLWMRSKLLKGRALVDALMQVFSEVDFATKPLESLRD